jgi:uncharacterized protein (TIGR04141 family)
MARQNTFTITLVKADKTEPDDIIDGNYSDMVPIQIDDVDIGQLFVRGTFHAAPKWARIFDNIVDTKIFGTTAAPAAVLLLKASERIFAVSFGFGYSLIADEAVEEQFGLRVTLNSIDAGAIKSLDKRSFDAVSTQTREQVSREIDVGEFGLDVDQDLLSNVTGTPRNKEWGEKMSGKHSLKVSVYKGIKDLPALCATYFERYKDSAYLARFKWIDQVREISDPELVEELDKILIARIQPRSDEPERCWLAVPDIMDWSDVDGFKFRANKNADTFVDIFWRDFFAQLGDDEELSLALLKRRRAIRVDVYGANREKWSLYKCINCEIDREEKMFLLNGGKWYEIEVDFVSKVNSCIAKIKTSDIRLIDYNHVREDEYLKDAAAALGDDCVCMDQDNISYGGGHSKIEFCDLLIGGHRFVHVKRYGSSSSLSHLFAQGVNSARLFVSDAEFRGAVNKKLPAKFKLVDAGAKISPSDYEIVFAIISNEAGDGVKLPFFSRVSLQNASQILGSYDFNVSLLKVSAKN